MTDHDTYIVESNTVKEYSPYTELIPTIREAFKEFDKGNVEMPAKQYLYVPNGDFRAMPAYLEGSFNASGIKWVNVHPNNTNLPTVMGVVVYTDPSTGEPLAVLNGTEVTGRRTGAAAAVATDRFSDPEANTLGLIGLGAQAYEQFNAITTIRNITHVYIADTSDKSIDRFKDTIGGELEITVGSPEEIAQSVDILSTLTPSKEPILTNAPEDGTHINAMGADAPGKQELSKEVFLEPFTKVFVDDYEQAIHSGEVGQHIENGALQKSDITGTLGNALNGELTFDPSSTTTIFDSTGLAIQDIATADLVYNSISADDILTADIM